MVDEREILQQASALIKQQQYGEAARLLETIPDDPKAKEWLAKLYERGVIAPCAAESLSVDELADMRAQVAASSVPSPTRSGSVAFFRMVIVLGMIAIIALQAVMIWVLLSDDDEQIEFPSMEFPETMQVDGAVSLKDAVDVRGPIEVHGRVGIDDAIEIDGPVDVTGTVQIDWGSDDSTELAVVRNLQDWDYLTVQYSQIGRTDSDVFPLVEIVFSNDAYYDAALFGDFICTDAGDEGLDWMQACAQKFQGQAYYLNLWGKDGWELVSVIDKSSSSSYSVEMILKRPRVSTYSQSTPINPTPEASINQSESNAAG